MEKKLAKETKKGVSRKVERKLEQVVSDAKSANCFRRDRSAAENDVEQLNKTRTEKCPFKGKLNKSHLRGVVEMEATLV